MRILVENFVEAYQSRVDYVVGFINDHPSCPDDVIIETKLDTQDISIAYGSEQGNHHFKIPAQQNVFSTEIHPTSNLFSNQYLWNDSHIYSVELVAKESREFLVDNQFQFDIIETIFFHLSRYEEYHCEPSQKDRWDMMREEQQFLVKNKLEKEPIVDRIVSVFLKGLGINPVEYKSEIRITHDIDLIKKFKSPLSFLRFNAYYLKNWKGAQPINELWKSYYRSVVNGEKAYDVFDRMLIKDKCEKEIYFLMGGKESVDTPLDTRSEIFKKAIKLSKDRDYKIGIHPSYATWKNQELLLDEKTKLEEIIDSEITISRQHYLHFSFTDTIAILEATGISQDSTIGYNRIIGFRAGTGVGFKLFDLAKNRVSSILEKPLAVMDSSLFDESKCNADRFLQIIDSFLDQNKYGTEITCNFHNSRFDDAKMFGLPQDLVYQNMING